MREIYAYVTTYCNKPRRMVDGKPIKHECYILPTLALKREREGDVRGAIDAIMHSPRKTHNGTRT
jgi:hypothetical protein